MLHKYLILIFMLRWKLRYNCDKLFIGLTINTNIKIGYKEPIPEIKRKKAFTNLNFARRTWENSININFDTNKNLEILNFQNNNYINFF